MARWLTSEKGMAAVIATFAVLVSVALVLATVALHRTADLARPSNHAVVERLKRGVRVMSHEDARQIIGTMSRKARAARP